MFESSVRFALLFFVLRQLLRSQIIAAILIPALMFREDPVCFSREYVVLYFDYFLILF